MFLPFKRLNSNIQAALNLHLVSRGYINGPIDNEVFSIKSEQTFVYFMEPKHLSSGFCIKIDLKDKDKSKIFIGSFGAGYQETVVDKDKKKKDLDKNTVIVKGYLDQTSGRNILKDTEIIFYQGTAPKAAPKLDITDRERKILYCFGVLKNNGMRREALSRLSVTSHEINDLIVKGALRSTSAGPAMTLAGEVNRKASAEDHW